MNETASAIEYCERALVLLRTKYHDPIQEAQCLQFLGYVHFAALCNFQVAQELLEESLRIYKVLLLEESSNCMDAIMTTGEVALICSRYEEAKGAFEKAAKIYRKTNRRDREADARIRLGLACLGLQLLDEAGGHLRDGLAIWEEIDHNWGKGTSYVALGDFAMSQDLFIEAEGHYTTALSCFAKDSGHWKSYEAESRLKMGILRIRTDQVEPARECLQRARLLYDEAGFRRGKADCSRHLAELDLKSSGVEVQRGALRRLEEVRSEYSDMGLQVEVLQCDKLIASTYRSLGEKPPKTLSLQTTA